MVKDNMSSIRKEAVPRCGWRQKGWHVNGALLLVFEVLEGSSTVSVVLVDFLPLTLLFWRQRRQVGIALALEQSAHVGLRRRCEQQHLHPVRQCPDVHGVGAGIWAADNIVQRDSVRSGLCNFISEGVLELGLFP